MNETIPHTIKQIEKNNDVVVLNIAPKKGEVFSFKPGQYVMLALYDKKGEIWQKRPFSICSSPLNKDYFQLAIKVHGEFTQKITTLKEGDSVGVSGPNGFFTFNEAKMKEVVFLAGGIGITPFMSAIYYISEKNLPNKVTLLYSNKTKEDILFFEKLKSISQKHKNIKVIFTLTDNFPNSWEYEKERIDKTMLKKYCFPFGEKYFSLCGPLKFMESIASQLKEYGISEDHIKMERF